MSGLLPRDVTFATLGLTSNTQTLVDYSKSGKRQARKYGGHKWSLTAKYPPMVKTDFDPVYAFLMQQDGAYGNFQVIPPDRSASSGSISAGGAICLRGDETGAWLQSHRYERRTWMT